MPQLILGIDQGFYKTCLAVVDQHSNIHYEDYMSYFNSSGNREEKHEYIISAILERMPQNFRKLRSIFIATNGYLEKEYPNIFRSKGYEFEKIITFNDTHCHYGLSDMKGHCVTFANGSFSNVRYYDGHNNSLKFPNLFNNLNLNGLISGDNFSKVILEKYIDFKLKNIHSDFIAAVENYLDYDGSPIYSFVDNVINNGDKSKFIDLSRLMEDFHMIDSISCVIADAVDKIIMLYKLFIDYTQDKEIDTIILGGSIWKYTFLSDLLKQKLMDEDDLQVKHTKILVAEGNPALGAINFGLKNIKHYDTLTYQTAAVNGSK